jgi:nucleoid-associated protein YgaU
MATTRGNLTAARIYEVDKKGNKKGNLEVACIFNPYEYTVSKSNTYSEKPKKNTDTAHAEFSKSGPQTLKLVLFFDTYETGKDVSQETRKLWRFMMTKEQKPKHKGDKEEPPQVAFEWGVFKFVAFITNMTQQFTLFTKDGTPVRAKVDATFTQFVDVEDYKPTNPTSGSQTSERIWRVTAGDRLDTIAAEVYDDATKWRLIAEHNRIVNPLAVRPGQLLRVPLD